MRLCRQAVQVCRRSCQGVVKTCSSEARWAGGDSEKKFILSLKPTCEACLQVPQNFCWPSAHLLLFGPWSLAAGSSLLRAWGDIMTIVSQNPFS